MRTKFSLSLTLETWILISFGSYELQKKQGKNFFDEAESPSGALKALISPKSMKSAIVLDGPAKTKKAKNIKI